MGFVKCYDVVSMVIEEATNQFSPLWTLDEDSYEMLKQYCSVIDSLAEEFNGESFDVSVDRIRMTIKIILECFDMVIESTSHNFYKLAQRSNSVSFGVSEDGNLNVEFVFPSVWRKI